MAQIGKSLKLKGEITGNEDLYIDGEVEGRIELKEHSLTVGPNGNVHADVSARSITILGRLQGNVKAGERTEIRKTGSFEGELLTAQIVIKDGAVFRGSVDVVKPGTVLIMLDESAPDSSRDGSQAERPSSAKEERP